MQSYNKLVTTKWAIVVIFMISLLLAPVTLAASGNQEEKGHVIIVKDQKTGTVIFKRNKSYHVGLQLPASGGLVSQGEIDPTEIIVKYKDGTVTTQDLHMLIDKITGDGVKISTVQRNPGLALVKLSQTSKYLETLEALNRNPEVEYAEPNYVARIAQVPNDPYFSRQWGLKNIGADFAWDKVDPGKRANVTIAVLDTGVNVSHEDLQPSIVPGYNVVNNNTNPADGNGHGTHVAGIAAAVTNNGRGIAGVAGGARIMPVKVMDDGGSGGYMNIINGIKYAVDHGAQVITMSLGGTGYSQAMQDAVNYATSRGVAVVAASGNSNGPVAFPGNCQGVITVGAVDSNNQRASFSNYGPEMDVAAPGVGIISSYKGTATSYATLSGTSMATPFVAGVAALVKAVNPNLGANQILSIFNQTSKDLGTAGFDNYYGYGLVDANRAVDLAMNGGSGTNPAPSPSPSPSPTPVPSPSPGSNLALGKPATASSVQSDSTFTAEKAFDGNPSTRWASQPGVDPQYIYVDLGKISRINRVVLKWEVAYAKAYRVYVSSDGRNWTTIYNTSYGPGGTNDLNVTGQGRYVLVYGLQRGDSRFGYSLWEVEVYGN